MKKFLRILGMVMLTSTSALPVISCVIPKQKELTIHDEIKKSLQNRIIFDNGWITDYSQSKENIETWTKTFMYSTWNFLNKLITYLVFQQLLKDIPNLMKHYPNFSLFASFILEDSMNIRKAIRSQQNVIFNYDVSYNLQQLQDIPFQDLFDNNILLPYNRTGMIRFYGRDIFGQYKILGNNSQNQLSFNQKNFIQYDKRRLNYLSKMLNDPSVIKVFDADYRKFLIMSQWLPYVDFSKLDFPSENLVKEIRDNSNIFNLNKYKILKNLKKNILEDYKIQHLFKSMPTVFDDLDIDILLVKAVLTSEIQDNTAMNYVYGLDRTYDKDMLIINVKTTLKMGNITSDMTIDEQLVLKIKYVE